MEGAFEEGHDQKTGPGETISQWKADSFPLGLQDDSGSAGGISSTSASVNRYILQLAQEYCGDCKNSFDELSKIIQVEQWERLESVLLRIAFKAALRLLSSSSDPG